MPNLTNICKIGNYFLHGWHGRLPDLQRQVDDYARIGAYGSGSQIVGYRARKASIAAWGGAPSKAEAVALAKALEDMQGTVVRVTDDFARLFEKVRIQEISATVRAGYGPTLPGGSQMLYCVDVSAVMEVLP